jgi:two-component system sensor histidine kinase HydH
MIQEVDRLNRVVGELNEFARPITIARKPIQIKSYLENSIELISNQASEANVTIQTTLAPEIDEVYIDPDRISQVLLNLYLNAIESMDGGGNLSVGLAVHADKEGVEIRISDSGAGISKDDLAHIFDLYFTTKPAGTGLGLAIVHNIIEAHQGEIKVESRPDQGTTFTIFLPNA